LHEDVAQGTAEGGGKEDGDDGGVTINRPAGMVYLSYETEF
jgi:hypothetical protein